MKKPNPHFHVRRLIDAALHARSPKARRNATTRLAAMERQGLLREKDPKPVDTLADRLRREAAEAANDAANAQRIARRAADGQR